MRDDRERILDILQAIERIERHAARGREGLESDELIQCWMVQHLQIIGEACRGLSADFRAAHPEIPWPEIIAMRNVLVHGYFAIDVPLVWTAVERDLPLLKPRIRALLEVIGESD